MTEGLKTFPFCSGLAVDAQGNAYFTLNEHHIRKVTPTGQVSVFAGVPGIDPPGYTMVPGVPGVSDVFASGFINGPGASARFSAPSGLAFDRDGNLLVADTGNKSIRKIDKDGVVSTLVDLAQVGDIGEWTKPIALAPGEGRSLWLLLRQDAGTPLSGDVRLARIAY